MKNERVTRSKHSCRREDAPIVSVYVILQNYSQRLSLFQQLCLLRCFRVDRVNLAIRSFIVHTMGEKYITPPPISFSEIYRLSNSMSPIVCIISPGADPAGDIQDLAIKMDMINRLKRVSLGQGQVIFFLAFLFSYLFASLLGFGIEKKKENASCPR